RLKERVDLARVAQRLTILTFVGGNQREKQFGKEVADPLVDKWDLRGQLASIDVEHLLVDAFGRRLSIVPGGEALLLGGRGVAAAKCLHAGRVVLRPIGLSRCKRADGDEKEDCENRRTSTFDGHRTPRPSCWLDLEDLRGFAVANLECAGHAAECTG